MGSGLDLSKPTSTQRIWNCNETAFYMSATLDKLHCKCGTSALHEVGGRSGREHATVYVCCSVSGE